MSIHRFDSFRDVLALQNRLQGILREDRTESGSEATASFVPPVDIYEDAGHIVLTIEAPGLAQDSFDIQFENNTLAVRGERKFTPETDAKQENYRRIERSYGNFHRAFALPQSVNPESIAATYDAGILRISIDKRAETLPRQIKVSAAPARTPEQQGAASESAA